MRIEILVEALRVGRVSEEGIESVEGAVCGVVIPGALERLNACRTVVWISPVYFLRLRAEDCCPVAADEVLRALFSFCLPRGRA